MDNFEEYLRQGEPDRVDKAKVWKTAIGLQQVDGLKPSTYLFETAKLNMEGDITIKEVKQRIDGYYKIHPIKNAENRTEEADKVSARITEILSEQTFSFSPAEYLTIYRRLFQGLYKQAGKIRDYNITKKEWVLNGETVLYGSAKSLKETLQYDFQQERQFNSEGLSRLEALAPLADLLYCRTHRDLCREGGARTSGVVL